MIYNTQVDLHITHETLKFLTLHGMLKLLILKERYVNEIRYKLCKKRNFLLH